MQDFYGIRIENIVQVVQSDKQLRGNFEGQGVLQFYDITMAPIQTKLMDFNLLTKEEVCDVYSFLGSIFIKIL